MNLIEHEDINIITKKNKIEKKDKNFYYLFLLLNLNLNINYNKYINNINKHFPHPSDRNFENSKFLFGSKLQSFKSMEQISIKIDSIIKEDDFSWFLKRFKI